MLRGYTVTESEAAAIRPSLILQSYIHEDTPPKPRNYERPPPQSKLRHLASASKEFQTPYRYIVPSKEAEHHTVAMYNLLP